MNSRKKICIITGTRAEYGLLKNLMQLIKESNLSELQLIATGTHLIQEYGLTLNHILEDGFLIDKKIDILMASDTPVAISKSIALAQIGYAEAFEELKPDIIVVLGDRYEILPAASAALIAGIPLAHIHGGEVTEGAIDESIRHAVTKLSHLHFTSTEEYRKRIIQMGEDPRNVHYVGAPGLDYLDNMKMLSLSELSISLEFNLTKPFGLITYHPVTIDNKPTLTSLNELLKALERFENLQFIITYPNADADGGKIINRLKEFADKNKNILLTPSLGQIRYLSAINNAAFVLGNSSSGIIEVPSFGKTTINIGDRQKGRITANSVLNCEENAKSIIKAIEYSLEPSNQEKVKKTKNPYKKGNSCEEIFNCIINTDYNQLKRKPFNDILVN